MLSRAPDAVRSDVDEALDIYNTNIVDDHYTMVEGYFVPLLARALRGDISGETAPKRMSIYYPLSPELALFFGEPRSPR